MSGGSFDYSYYKVEEMADSMAASKSSLRRAFGKHLRKVAKAMHDVEWVDSSDYGRGDEDKAINEVLNDGKAAQIDILIDDARTLIKELTELIAPIKE